MENLIIFDLFFIPVFIVAMLFAIRWMSKRNN